MTLFHLALLLCAPSMAQNLPNVVGDKDTQIDLDYLDGRIRKQGIQINNISSPGTVVLSTTIGGGGVNNQVAKWVGAKNIGNSQIFDNGTSVGFNTNTPLAGRQNDFESNLIDGYTARFQNTTGVRGHVLELLNGASDRTAWVINANNAGKWFSDGSLTTSGDNTFGITDFISSVTAQTTVGFRTKPWADVLAYGCKGDGTTDDSTCLQNALNSGAGVIYLPANTYSFGTTLTIPNNITVHCADRQSTVLKYTGTAVALSNSNPVNGSGFGRVNIENCQITTGSNNAKTALELVTGGFSYYTVDRCDIEGNYIYGVVLDQCEICNLTRNIFANSQSTYTVAVWITNGNEYRSGGLTGFSNVIQLQNNQFNTPGYAFVDDGGNDHVFQNNNVNGSSMSLRMAGVTNFRITGNSFESNVQQSTTPVLFSNLGWNRGTLVGAQNKTVNQGGVINSNTFSDASATTGSLLAFLSTGGSHTGIIVEGNWFDNKLGIGNTLDITNLSSSTIGPNYDGNKSGITLTGIQNIGPLYITGGNFGVGTTSPTTPMDINGAATFRTNSVVMGTFTVQGVGEIAGLTVRGQETVTSSATFQNKVVIGNVTGLADIFLTNVGVNEDMGIINSGGVPYFEATNDVRSGYVKGGIDANPLLLNFNTNSSAEVAYGPLVANSSFTAQSKSRFEGNIECASCTITMNGAGVKAIIPLVSNATTFDSSATFQSNIQIPNNTAIKGMFSGSPQNMMYVDTSGNTILGDNAQIYTKSLTSFVGLGLVPAFKFDTNTYERITNACTGVTSCTATCSAGKQVTGGGCTGVTSVLADSASGSATTWVCTITSGNVTAQAICMAIN